MCADKVCDQVSDAVLDACIKDDETSRVACECCTKTGMIMIFGEITTSATVNYEAVIRETLREIGYDDPAKGMDYRTVNVIVAVEEQSPDIASVWMLQKSKRLVPETRASCLAMQPMKRKPS